MHLLSILAHSSTNMLHVRAEQNTDIATFQDDKYRVFVASCTEGKKGNMNMDKLNLIYCILQLLV